MEEPALPDDAEEWLRGFAKRQGVPLEVLDVPDRDEPDAERLPSVAVEFGMNELLALHGKEHETVTVGGRFRLIRRVGRGSYGSVYEAEDGELARRVAIKVMPIGDPDVADLEGKALAACDHPNIVRIFGHGRKDDYRWLELEFIDGPTLDKWCRGKSVDEIVACYLEAGEGLEAAHDRGLIHRDFKPQNVLMTDEGRAKVTDFGLARNLESLTDRAPDEGSHLFGSGTLGFLSRERLQGAAGDERSDQFAFCVSLWWALTGTHPFEVRGKLADYFESMGRRPKNSKKVPRRIRRVLERGMAPLPGDRWQTMSQLLEALKRASSRSPWWWLGLVLVLGGVTSTWLAVPDSPTTIAVDRSVVDEMTLEVLAGVKAHDHDAVVQALSTGYPVARREGRQLDFSKVAKLAAQSLETEGNTFDAQFAWWMAARLSDDGGAYDPQGFNLGEAPNSQNK